MEKKLPSAADMQSTEAIPVWDTFSESYPGQGQSGLHDFTLIKTTHISGKVSNS